MAFSLLALVPIRVVRLREARLSKEPAAAWIHGFPAFSRTSVPRRARWAPGVSRRGPDHAPRKRQRAPSVAVAARVGIMPVWKRTSATNAATARAAGNHWN